MTHFLDNIEERVELGQSILKQFFELSDKELIEKLKDMIGDDYHARQVLEGNPDIRRITKNDIPETITLSCYDTIEMEWAGVGVKPEHGEYKSLKQFDKYFKFN